MEDVFIIINIDRFGLLSKHQTDRFRIKYGMTAWFVMLSISEISLARFVWDSLASRAEGENRKFIIGKSIFSIWIWVYPFSARRSRLRPLNDVNYILDCFKIKDFSQWQIKLTDITISLQSLNETMKKLVLSER